MRPGSLLVPTRSRAVLGAGLSLLLVPCLVSLPVAAAPVEPEPPRRVVLARDAGSVTSSAEVGLSTGLTRLRTSSYEMVAATWRGRRPAVSVRTEPGGPWRELPRLVDGPSAGQGERVPGLHGTDLLWTGPRTGIDVRVSGTRHRRLRLVLIEPGETSADRGTARADQDAPAARTDRPDRAPRPDLRSRRDWGADPRWRNGRPAYTDTLKQVHVHHTATGNGYRRSDVPGLLRGMYRYHTRSLGWFDLGYNFLVDRFGRAWVGRSGGAGRLVRGAHTLGFNERSVGIAVIGTLEARRPSRAAVGALVRLAAWKLDRYDRRATGRVRVTSTGSDKYRDGRRVRLKVIDGHRDTNHTACPGHELYDRLHTVRLRTQTRMDRFD